MLHQLTFPGFDQEPDTNGLHANRLPAADRGVTGSITAQLERQIFEERPLFPGRFIYPELVNHYIDPFSNSPAPDLSALRADLIVRYALDVKPESFTYRPDQVEFVRYFLDQEKGNAILQAPTDSGKTEVALLIASHSISHHQRVIFLAPTNEIVDQICKRAEKMLNVVPFNMNGLSPHMRHGSVVASDPQLIVSVPHVILNDMQAGKFSLRPGDLLIVDETHHAVGQYPYVPIIKAATELNSRVLLLSATPSQLQPGNSWQRLEELKELVGIDHIFPMNKISPRKNTSTVSVPLSEQILNAESKLLKRFSEIKSSLKEHLHEIGDGDLIKMLGKASGVRKDTFIKVHLIKDLYAHAGKHLNGDDRYRKVLSDLRALQEIAELRNKLVDHGIHSLLLNAFKNRLDMIFQPDGPAPRYLGTVYSTHHMHQIFSSLAGRVFDKLWFSSDIKDALHIPQGLDLGTRQGRKFLRTSVHALLENIQHQLIENGIENHPKDIELLSQLRNHGSDATIVFARDREHVFYLTRLINRELAENGIRAGAFTGRGENGSDGMTRTMRSRQLERFNSRELNVLVSTIAGAEGIDFQGVSRGFILHYSASFIQAYQQKGRIGRGEGIGSISYIYSNGEEYGKYLTLLRKELGFMRMLKKEREQLVASLQAGSLNEK